MASFIKRVQQVGVLTLLSISIMGCGEKIGSGLPDANTTMYFSSNTKVNFSVSGPTGKNIYYGWQVTHYDSNNQPVDSQSLGQGSSLQKIEYQFDATATQHFRTEVAAILWVYDELASQFLNRPIYKIADQMTWELSKPVEKFGSQILGSFFARNQNDLDQLTNVTTIVNNLFVDGSNYRDITKLTPITSVGGSVSVNASAFHSMTELALNPALNIGGNLTITNNKELRNLLGLEHITHLNNLVVENNRYLANLSGLNNLKNIDGELSLNKNDGLTSLKGLDSLQQVNNDFVIKDNAAIKSLNGVKSLSDIGGTLDIGASGSDDSAGKLADLSGLESVTHIGKLSLRRNLSLVSLHGLENVDTLPSITLSENSLLQSLSSLSGVTHLDSLVINGNAQLKNLEGLENLDSIGTLQISSGYYVDGFGITSLKGIESIKSLKDLALNSTLISDVSLFNTIPITHSLVLNNNQVTQLPHLAANSLEMLEIVNERISNLDGVDNLTHLGSLMLNYNPYLNDISSLDKLSRIDGDLMVLGNESLCGSDATALLTQLQHAQGVGGTVTLDGNKACN